MYNSNGWPLDIEDIRIHWNQASESSLWMQPEQRILFIVQSPTPTHCNHTFRLVACCSFAGVKRTTRPEHNQSHSRSLGRIELAFNHRWASEQFPSTKFPTWLWSTRGTGFQALSQECRELALNQGPLVYEAEALTAGPLAMGRRNFLQFLCIFLF